MSTKALAKSDPNTLRATLEQAAPKLAEVAPKHLKVDRMVRLLLAAANRNPKILKCSRESVLQFAMKCSETGLEPIGAGGAWPVPYENRQAQTVELQFIPDYRGLINAAKRAGCIKDAYAETVKSNDEFDYELGLDLKLTHRPARGERGELESAYCVIVLPDGAKRFVVMDAEEIAAIRARSKARDKGPWVTDVGEMWKKTVVRRAMKPFAGASPELTAAIEADNAVSGITFEREPIPMPRRRLEAAAEVSSQEVEDGNSQTSDSQLPAPAVATATADTPQKRILAQLAADGITEADFIKALRKTGPKDLKPDTILGLSDKDAEDVIFNYEDIAGVAKQ